MISVNCPRHGRRVLLTERHIRGMRNTHRGIVVDWTCWCGHRGATRTGRPRPTNLDAIA